MKKALVFYLYSNRNAGDMAICLGTIRFLKQQGFDITFVSRFGQRDQEYAESCKYLAQYEPDVQVVPGFFDFDRSDPFFTRFRAYAQGFIKVAIPGIEKQLRLLLSDCDVVFFNGGNLLRGHTFADYMRLAALFYPIHAARKVGKKIYCLSQSSSKLDWISKRMLNRYLSDFDQIYVREKMSYLKLKSTFPQMPFVRSTDMAFCIGQQKIAEDFFQKKYGYLPSDFIAVVVRYTQIGDLGMLPETVQQQLNSRVTEYMSQYPQSFYLVVIQTEKDRLPSYELVRQVRQNCKVDCIEEHDPYLLREIYRRARFVLTMRLHAAILAMSVSTPVMGIFSEKWGLKNSGILSDYQMPYLIVEQQPYSRISDFIPVLAQAPTKDIPKRIQSFFSSGAFF